jgi:hypothetical protein
MLLFSNLAFLAWSQWVDIPPPTATADSASSLPRLRLVEEKAPTSQRVMAGRAQVAQCVSVGPFDDLPSATHGADVLRKKGFESRQRLQQGASSEGFWVFVGGLASDAVASQAMHNLTENGIKDATVLRPSEEERRIAAGLFTEREQANQRAQEIRRLGLRVEIAERKLPGTQYWVDVALSPEGGTLPAQGLYLKGPSSRIGAKPCPEGSTPPGNSTDGQPLAPQRRAPGSRATVASIPKPL